MSDVEAATDLAAPSENESAPRAVDWNNPRVAAILEAAAKCFARKGFSATTLAEIGKELGLRKSIVHYYFASKAALIHEVQSFSYHQYLDGVREAIKTGGEGNSADRGISALRSLWGALKQNRTSLWLNIEVWATARRDEELRRRAAALHKDSRALVAEGVGDVLGGDASLLKDRMDSVSSLILGVLNGLSVAEYLEGEDSKADEAYELFLILLRLGIRELEQAQQQA